MLLISFSCLALSNYINLANLFLHLIDQWVKYNLKAQSKFDC